MNGAGALEKWWRIFGFIWLYSLVRKHWRYVTTSLHCFWSMTQELHAWNNLRKNISESDSERSLKLCQNLYSRKEWSGDKNLVVFFSRSRESASCVRASAAPSLLPKRVALPPIPRHHALSHPPVALPQSCGLRTHAAISPSMPPSPVHPPLFSLPHRRRPLSFPPILSPLIPPSSPHAAQPCSQNRNCPPPDQDRSMWPSTGEEKRGTEELHLHAGRGGMLRAARPPVGGARRWPGRAPH
jgi:hypothetical protein